MKEENHCKICGRIIKGKAAFVGYQKRRIRLQNICSYCFAKQKSIKESA